jgi:outer membrane protein TolC
MMLTRRSRAIYAVALSLPFAGCAISPNPLSEAELSQTAADQRARVTANQEPISQAVTLYEAMARALKYNLDKHVEEAEYALRLSELDLAHHSLLPNLVANSAYTGRNNDNASFSKNIFTGAESVVTSTSQERRLATADATFSWNILDFGLSYVRAQQAADKSLIQKELARKVAHRITEDVRSAFWRAVTADQLIDRLSALERRTKSALSESRALFKDRQTSPIGALTQERELLEIQRTLVELQRELASAKTQLAALMNVTPGTRFTLVAPDRTASGPRIARNAEDMIATALVNRSELREVAYKRRINAKEAEASLLELLPGIQIFAGANSDSNAFLYNNQWVGWGARASFNVMKLFSAGARRDVIAAQDDMLDKRALALTMAVMTQVHVARIRYVHTSRELDANQSYLEVQRKLLHQIRNEANEGRVSQQTLIREELNALVAEAKRNIAFAQMQTAFGNLFASMGLDPLPLDIAQDATVASLASALKGTWLERGDTSAGWARRRIASAN